MLISMYKYICKKYFSHSINCLFTIVKIPFEAHNLLTDALKFFFYHLCFCYRIKEILKFTPVFFQLSLFLVLTSRSMIHSELISYVVWGWAPTLLVCMSIAVAKKPLLKGLLFLPLNLLGSFIKIQLPINTFCNSQ